MKRSNIKNLLDTGSTIAILGFVVIEVLTSLFDVDIKDHRDLQNLSVVAYLILRVFYYKLDGKDKDEKIAELENQLRKKES